MFQYTKTAYPYLRATPSVPHSHGPPKDSSFFFCCPCTHSPVLPSQLLPTPPYQKSGGLGVQENTKLVGGGIGTPKTHLY